MMDNNEKQVLRNEVRARLAELTREVYMERAERALRNTRLLLTAVSEQRNLRTVLTYSAVLRWREVDVSSLETEFSDVAFTAAPAALDAPLPVQSHDVILVPLFGFTSNGYRLGRGGGWYDRLLAQQLQALIIGIGIEVGRTDFTPEPHDVPMDYIVTEEGYEKINRSS